MENKATIKVDSETKERFERFCKFEQELQAASQAWKELKSFTEKMQFGSLTLTVKNGSPYRIDKAMQTVLLVAIK